MTVKVLGTGCPKCQMLEARVREIVGKNGLTCDIEKITDLKDIMSYGILMTPGLVIDGVVKSSGRIPKEEELLRWLRGE